MQWQNNMNKGNSEQMFDEIQDLQNVDAMAK